MGPESTKRIVSLRLNMRGAQDRQCSYAISEPTNTQQSVRSRIRYKVGAVAVVKGKERYLTVTSSTGIDRYASNEYNAVAGYEVVLEFMGLL